jgi:hypothetical protein
VKKQSKTRKILQFFRGYWMGLKKRLNLALKTVAQKEVRDYTGVREGDRNVE